MNKNLEKSLSCFIQLLETIVGEKYENKTFILDMKERKFTYKEGITIRWYNYLNHIYIEEDKYELPLGQMFANCLESVADIS